MMNFDFKYLSTSSEKLLGMLINKDISLPYFITHHDDALEQIKELDYYKYITTKMKITPTNTNSNTWEFGRLSATVLNITKNGMLYFEMKELHEKNNNKNNVMNIYGNIDSSQIQQGTINSTQNMIIEFDYDKAISVIDEINKYASNKNFDEDYGDNSDKAKGLITDIHSMIRSKEDPAKIKHALSVLKDLSIGVSSSLIASGVVGLITQLLS